LVTYDGQGSSSENPSCANVAVGPNCFPSVSGNGSESTIDFHNYITIDNKDDKVSISATFPRQGSYTLTVFARNSNSVDDSDLFLPIYVKIIEVVLPTLTGMPVPTTAILPLWCNGFSLKEPKHCYLPANEKVMLSISIPEAYVVLDSTSSSTSDAATRICRFLLIVI
jgi:hypothetical protein